MGIQGLLGMLKEASVPQHINQWKGKTLAVDAYVWLHRGAYGCAEELATGKTTIKYVNYAMHRVRMLKHYGVTPLIVFDGGLLPSKMGTEDDRERRRNDALAKGNAFLAEGKGSQARDCFVKAVDVTPEMAYQLIKALRREGVQYIVAPYEADPQLAYLERAGLVDGIISEDSDLLVFGCRQVLFKLDGEGNCVGIARDDFTKCREYNFAGWTDKEFRQMAILSGCDYLESIQGVGLKTAYRLMRKYKTAEKVIQFVRLEGQLKVPRSYPDDFKRAELTFLHQRVWDPVQNALVHLEPVPAGVDAAVEWPFIGA
ncbi:PIN domain-like protein [Leucosporidium creatinivorum]|uniref:PIN domain-like protein n=1 Tax=Leucosporidium creatinivorum TaxID=106004 RepID=A0A1Y2G479_9BASI|nr:PIN domain-like protein [Leucosporidium creatinivorum]